MNNDTFVNVSKFELDTNFWQLNPDLAYMSGFRPIYNIDQGGDESSIIMWSIYFYTDLKSKFRRMSELQRKTEIAELFGKDVVNFDNPLMIKGIDYYREICLTTAQRNFAEWEDMLNERTEWLKALPWTLDHYAVADNGKSILVKGTASDKDNMLSKTGKHWEMYMKLKDEMNKEEASGQLRGGGSLSFLEEMG